MNHPPDAMRPAATATADDEDFLRRAARAQQLLRELADAAPEAVKGRIAEVEQTLAAICAGEPEGDQAGGSSASVVETVCSHPVQVAVSAIGVGVLTWWLLGRRA
jgi:hypothetical protein